MQLTVDGTSRDFRWCNFEVFTPFFYAVAELAALVHGLGPYGGVQSPGDDVAGEVGLPALSIYLTS